MAGGCSGDPPTAAVAASRLCTGCAVTLALLQVGDFFARCNTNVDANVRTIESDGVAEIGEL